MTRATTEIAHLCTFVRQLRYIIYCPLRGLGGIRADPFFGAVVAEHTWVNFGIHFSSTSGSCFAFQAGFAP